MKIVDNLMYFSFNISDENSITKNEMQKILGEFVLFLHIMLFK